MVLPRDARARSAIYQAVCSPFRNPLDRHERVIARLGSSSTLAPLARRLARRAGVREAPIRWRLTASPTFDNQFGTLELHDRHARVRIERTVRDSWPRAETTTTLERELA